MCLSVVTVGYHPGTRGRFYPEHDVGEPVIKAISFGANQRSALNNSSTPTTIINT
jgi:hypothetical protein